MQRSGDGLRLHGMGEGREHEEIERRLARALAAPGDGSPGLAMSGVHERAAVLRRRRAGIVSGVAALAVALPVGVGIDALQERAPAPVAAPAVAPTASSEPSSAPVPVPVPVETASAAPQPTPAPTEPGATSVPPLDRDADGLLVVPQEVGSGLSGAVPDAEYYGYLPFPSGAFLQNVVAACMEHTPEPVGDLAAGGGSWTYVLDEEDRGLLYGSADVRVDLYEGDGAALQTAYLRERAGDCSNAMDLTVVEQARGEEAGLVAVGAEDGSAVVVVGTEPAQRSVEFEDPSRAGAVAVAVVDSVQVRAAVSRRGDGTGPEVRERVRAESVVLLTAAVAAVAAADVPARAEASR